MGYRRPRMGWSRIYLLREHLGSYGRTMASARAHCRATFICHHNNGHGNNRGLNLLLFFQANRSSVNVISGDCRRYRSLHGRSVHIDLVGIACRRREWFCDYWTSGCALPHTAQPCDVGATQVQKASAIIKLRHYPQIT